MAAKGGFEAAYKALFPATNQAAVGIGGIYCGLYGMLRIKQAYAPPPAAPAPATATPAAAAVSSSGDEVADFLADIDASLERL
mmetsp:Transcript_1490/g.1958  ORF Transcript_1490/g.1958 Transcript_1490/m.1958 type:complete len:83 (-) Transcript_1490:160-408(-)|eukprot:CAMPEP_0175103522 /NCGR_PEP_ID=MMETSP0086_2-20121207/9137_1 /TAXON_ID=136419 /ORGANISM="Unknown Unknown, Strain D1" /LENGTH=82 /DNA_ID=CAMNT_0016378649 /DNA_START=28 /DNA_END=276 /DNA_ORIENTATION=+